MRPKLLTKWWLRAAYILCCVGAGVVIATLEGLPLVLMVGVCAGYGVLMTVVDARRSDDD